MKVEFWVVGKTNKAFLKEGIQLYTKRINRYVPFHLEIIPDIKNAKNLSAEQLKSKEGERILSKLKPTDFLLLLDEKAQQHSSLQFAELVEQILTGGSSRRLIICIGGAFGSGPAIHKRANKKLSLSKLTFSHQMVRLIFVEQFYRAMTILRNEPYHKE